MTTRLHTFSTAAASLLLAVCLMGPAHALDPMPQGQKEKQRHVFRDVQMGLSHPTDTGKSTPTPAATPPLFPWLLPPADPSVGTGGTGTK